MPLKAAILASVLIGAGLAPTQSSAQDFDMEFVYGAWTRCIIVYEHKAAESQQSIDDLIPYLYDQCIPEEHIVIERLTKFYHSESMAWNEHMSIKGAAKLRSRADIARFRIEMGR